MTASAKFASCIVGYPMTVLRLSSLLTNNMLSESLVSWFFINSRDSLTAGVTLLIVV